MEAVVAQVKVETQRRLSEASEEETAEVTVAAMVEASVVVMGEVLEAAKAAAAEGDSVEEGGLVAEEDLEHPAAEKAVAVEKARPAAEKAVVKVVEAVEEKAEEMVGEKEEEKVVVAAPARQSQLEGRDP
jgi:hypothetical protein